MKFSNATDIQQTIWDMKLVDVPRSTNRGLFNDLANGVPPLTPLEAEQEGDPVNVNWLDYPKILHDGRRQLQNGLKTSSNFFRINLDYGPQWRRTDWSLRLTSGINKAMKESRAYSDVLDGVIANVILHGVGPTAWEDGEKWCPYDLTVGDVLVPSNTLRSMENLEYFAIFRKYSAWNLWKMTRGVSKNAGWNLSLADKCFKWCLRQSGGQVNTNDLTWSPEKMAEEMKANGGAYTRDSIPTIDCWDFYFFNDSDKKTGWNRRIVLDMNAADGQNKMELQDKEFLFDSGERKYASKISQILHVQFGDASCVSPFRWHSVRSLGFLLYSVCHLQNRLRCKFNDHVFQSMMQYFRAGPNGDELLKKVDLTRLSVIPEGLDFMKASDRWAIDQNLVQMAMGLNRQSMSDQSLSYTQDYDFEQDRQRKTATQFMGEQSATNALVASMLNNAYDYEKHRHMEICRRFCVKNSKDADVREFRKCMLKQGIPEEALDPERWEIVEEKVIGSGNEQIAIGRANMLMSQINRYDPESQKTILREYTFAATKDAGLTDNLVPQSKNIVTDSVHDAQLAAGTLMMGLPVSIKTGMNHVEYVETLLAAMALLMQKAEARGGMATADEIAGFQNMATHIDQHIQLIAQDKNEKARVKQYGDSLGELMNIVKSYAQRLQEQQQAQGAQGQPGQPNPVAEAEAKKQALLLQTQAKIEAGDMTTAAKEKRKEAQFEADQQRKAQSHQLEMAGKLQEVKLTEAATDLRTAGEIQRANEVAKNQPKKEKDTE